MTNQASVDQLTYLFKFPFKDQDWKSKLLIAFLLTLASIIIPIVPVIFLAGYAATIMKMGIDGEEFHLPEWADWDELLIKGLRLFGVGFIATLPLILLFACSYLTLMAPAFSTLFIDPSNADELSPAWALSFLVAPFGGMCLIGLSMFLALFIGFIIQPAIGHTVAESRFSAAFRFPQWWAILKANIGGYLISYILILGSIVLMTFAAQFLYLTLVLCCLVPILGSLMGVYLSVIMGAMSGQAYRVGRENLRHAASLDDAPQDQPQA